MRFHGPVYCSLSLGGDPETIRCREGILGSGLLPGVGDVLLVLGGSVRLHPRQVGQVLCVFELPPGHPIVLLPDRVVLELAQGHNQGEAHEHSGRSRRVRGFGLSGLFFPLLLLLKSLRLRLCPGVTPRLFGGC